MFELIKERYYASKSLISRLLELRGVKKVSFVKFMHAPGEPDIHESRDNSDNWPPAGQCPPWDYEGCRTGKHPSISPVRLLHQWRNPSHSDKTTYDSHPKSLAEKIRVRLRNIRAAVVEVATNIPMTTLRHSETQTSNEPNHEEEALPTEETTSHGDVRPQNPDMSRYIFLRTPKKLGEQLIPDDRATPEAWGLYFEEGLLLHHVWLIILCIYIMATAAFGAYWCAEYGLVGPGSGAAAFAIASWMIGLFSLVMTVMFKWAE
ncbi:MAG: hypothetical protein Q9226_004299 [Calogaya cf. arnoldii]